MVSKDTIFPNPLPYDHSYALGHEAHDPVCDY